MIDEDIDLIPDPGVVRSWNSWPGDGLKGPVLFLGGSKVGARRERLRFRFAPWCPSDNPLAEQGKLLCRNGSPLLWHLARFDHLDQPTRIRLARHDQRLTAVARSQHEPVQPQVDAAGDLRLFAVAVSARRPEDWPDVAVE